MLLRELLQIVTCYRSIICNETMINRNASFFNDYEKMSRYSLASTKHKSSLIRNPHPSLKTHKLRKTSKAILEDLGFDNKECARIFHS